MSKVLIVGDLHLYDGKVGRHKDYWSVCIQVLNDITEAITKEKITHLILAGDVVGLSTKVLRERKNLIFVLSVFRHWRMLLNGNVYAISGNHDKSGNVTEFDVLESAESFKHVTQLDVGNLRVHMLDFGGVGDPITLLRSDGESEVTNVAVVHETLSIEGITDFGHVACTPLSSYTNLKGVDLVVAGDWHIPSPVYDTTIEDEDISLVYVGCPTRPTFGRNLYTFTQGVILSVGDNNKDATVDMDMIRFNLPPVAEVFNLVGVDDDIDIEAEDEIAESPVLNIEELKEVFAAMESFNIGAEVSWEKQIDLYAVNDPVVGAIAKDYFHRASDIQSK